MKRLNFRLASIFLVAVAALGCGVYFLHKFQVDRNAGNWLIDARDAATDKNYVQADQAYRRYLELRNTDGEAWAEYVKVCKTLFDEKPTEDSFRNYYAACQKTIGFHPDDADVREQFLDLTLKVREVAIAEQQIKELRRLGKLSPKIQKIEADLTLFKGNAESAKEKYAKIIGFDLATGEFDATVADAARDFKAHELLGDLLADTPSTIPLARKLVADLTKRHIDRPEAQLAVYRLCMRPGALNDKDAGLEALNKAIALAPDDKDVIAARFDVELRGNHPAEARKMAEKLIRIYPNNPTAYILLATTFSLEKKTAEALAALDQGLAILPDSPPLLGAKLDLEFSKTPPNVKAAEDLIGRLRKSGGIPPETLLLQEGRLLTLTGKWSAALAKLDVAVKRLTDNRLITLANRLRSMCHGQLGNYDVAKNLNAGILAAAPNDLEIRLQSAMLDLRAGRSRDALNEYEAIASTLGPEQTLKSSAVWRALYQLRIETEAAKPAEQRDWSSAEDLLAKIEARPDTEIPASEKSILRSRLKSRQGDSQAALTLLEKLRDDDPQNVAYWLEWSTLDLAHRKPSEILAGLEKAPESVRKNPIMMIAQANLWTLLGGDEGRAGLLKLLDSVADVDGEERLQLHLIVGQSLLRMRDFAGANAVADKALALTAQTKPRDMRPFRLLADIAKQSGDLPGTEKVLAEIRKHVSAEDDFYRYGRAQYLILKVRTAQKGKIRAGDTRVVLSAEESRELSEAETLVEAMLENRRDWDDVYKLQSEIAALKNDPESMLAALRVAQTKGDLETPRLRQLATLAYQAGDLTATRIALQQLAARGDQSLFKLNFQMLLQEGAKDEAAKLLTQYELNADAPPEEFLWKAQALRQIGRFEESEALLRDLIRDDDALKYPEGWLTLLAVMQEAKKETDIRKLMNRLRGLPESEIQCLVAARAAEQLGDNTLAQQYYAKAVQRDPQSLRPRRELAGYYIRAKLDQMALNSLDTLLELCAKKPDDPQAANYSEWATRAKVVTDVGSGQKSYEDFKKYDAQLAAAAAADQAESSDLLLRISLLSGRSEPESLRKAIALIRELDVRQPLQKGDQLLLARLLQRVGKWDEARSIIEKLALNQAADPSFLVAYAEMLAQNGDYSGAQRYLEIYIRQTGKSEPLQPLLAQVLFKQNQPEAARKILEKWLGPRPVPAASYAKLQTVADLLKSSGRIDEAEDYYRELGETGPDGKLAYANFLGRYRDVNAALDLFDGLAKNDDTRMAAIAYATEMLRFRRDDLDPAALKSGFDRLGAWYKIQRDARPTDVNLKTILAEVRVAQGKYAEAAQSYREAIELLKDAQPANSARLKNNLAYVLALSGDKAVLPEASQAIADAIRWLGPQSDLIDTRASIALMSGDYARAEADLQDAVLSPSAAKWFRLAYASWKLGKKDEAQSAMSKARDLQFDPRDLAPNERTFYRELTAGLK